MCLPQAESQIAPYFLKKKTVLYIRHELLRASTHYEVHYKQSIWDSVCNRSSLLPPAGMDVVKMPPNDSLQRPLMDLLFMTFSYSCFISSMDV